MSSVGPCRLRTVHLQEGFIPTKTPRHSINTFVPSLTKPFIDAGVHCVASIQAPSPTAPPKRFASNAQPSQQSLATGLKTEVIRFRSDACRGILLNHILILPVGQQLLNGTVIGQTIPAPSQCRLEGFASDQNAALVLPLDTPAQKAQAVRTAGQYTQLAASEGSIPQSLVLVPPVVSTGDSEYPEFPMLLMADTLVIRGIYERLTICIFGTRIPSSADWSLASKRLWMHYACRRQGLSELGCVELHRREDVEGRVDVNEELPDLMTPAAVNVAHFSEVVKEKREMPKSVKEIEDIDPMSDETYEEVKTWLADLALESTKDREKMLARFITLDSTRVKWEDLRLDSSWKDVEQIMRLLCYTDRVPNASSSHEGQRRVVKLAEGSRSEGVAISDYLSAPPGLFPLLTDVVTHFLTEKRNNIYKPEEWISIILKSLQLNLPIFKSHKICQLRILGRILTTNPGLATTGLGQDLLLIGQKAISSSPSDSRRSSRVPVVWQRECLHALQTLGALCNFCSATRRTTSLLSTDSDSTESSRLSALEKCAGWITALASPFGSLETSAPFAKFASSDKFLFSKQETQKIAASHLVLSPALINAIKRYELIPILVNAITQPQQEESEKVKMMSKELVNFLLSKCYFGSSLFSNGDLERLREHLTEDEGAAIINPLAYLRYLDALEDLPAHASSHLMLMAATAAGRKALTLFSHETRNGLIHAPALERAWTWVCQCLLQDPSGPDALECLAALHPKRWEALTRGQTEDKYISLYCALSSALKDPTKIPEMLTRLVQEPEKVGIVSSCPAAVRKVARLQTDLRMGELAEKLIEILGGWEAGLGVPAPGFVRDPAAPIDFRLSRVRMLLLSHALQCVVDRQKFLVESSKETETATSQPGDTLLDQLSWISPLLMQSAFTAAQNGLLIATRHLRLSEKEMEARSLLPKEGNEDLMESVQAFHLARSAISTITSSVFREGTRRQLLQPELLKNFILLLETLMRMEQKKVVKDLFEAILKDVMYRWFHWTNIVTQKWLVSESLRLCKGTPLLDRLRLILMMTFGENALASLHPSNSNLQWSAARSPQVPPMLPSQMAGYPAGALEAAQSLVVTMASSSCVTRPHLAEEGPIPADRIASEREEFDPRNRRVPTDMICYLCCQVPGANFVSVDSKRVCVISRTYGLFGRPVFGPLGNDPVSAVTFDLLADIVTRPLRETLKLEAWRIFQAGIVGLEQIASLMDLIVISLTDSSDELALQLCLCVAVSVFNGGLPLLSMLGHRLEMIISVEVEKPADREMTIQRLQRASAVISAAPHMLTDEAFASQDSIWITQALNSVSRGLIYVHSLTAESPPIETRVALKTAACGIGALESLLFFVRRHRDVGSLFVLLTRTREIVEAVIKLLDFCLARFTRQELLQHLPDLCALLHALTSCFLCPFTRALMVFDFTKTTIDSLSQDIFGANAEGLMSKKAFPTDRQTAVGSIKGLVDAIAGLPEDEDFRLCIPLLEKYIACREASTKANDIPLEAVHTFFGHSTQSETQTRDLLNDTSSATAFHTILMRLESSGSELAAKWAELFDKDSRDAETSSPVTLSFASLWENPEHRPPPMDIWTSPKDWEEFVKNRLAGLVTARKLRLSVMNSDSDGWTNFPEVLQRLQPLVSEGAEDLGLSSLPLRIPMESCEEPDAFDDLNCRQKRSVFAKAAKMNQQQLEGQMDLTEAATPSVMDDWGTFIPQLQSMRRPEQRNVVELSFAPEVAPTYPVEQPPPQQTVVDDKFAQLSAIPEFRNFIEAGREINLPVMDIIKNPSLLLDEMLKARFLKLVESHPWVMQLIQ